MNRVLAIGANPRFDTTGGSGTTDEFVESVYRNLRPAIPAGRTAEAHTK
jgi:hypothetical protein